MRGEETHRLVVTDVFLSSNEDLEDTVNIHHHKFHFPQSESSTGAPVL